MDERLRRILREGTRAQQLVARQRAGLLDHENIVYAAFLGDPDALQMVDSEEFVDCMKWISDNTGADTALHLSRYFPRYRSSVIKTPVSKLIEFHDIARDFLNYVYLGNIDFETGRNTSCPQCGQLIASRTGYSTIIMGSDELGNCTGCNRKVFKYSNP